MPDPSNLFTRIRRIGTSSRAAAAVKRQLLRRRDPRAYAHLALLAQVARLQALQREQEVVPVRITADEAFVETPTGFLLLYNAEDLTKTMGDGQTLELASSYGHDVTGEIVLGALGDGDVYIDVGANNGYYYALQVARAHPSVTVLAFEPDPHIGHHLARNLEVNGATSVEVVSAGLSDRSGTARLSDGLGASNFVVADADVTTAGLSIRTETLDSIVTARSLDRVDVIKVDIEGGEHRFLLGAVETLRQCRPVVVLELRAELLERRGDSLPALLDLVDGLHYDVFAVPHSADAVLVPRDRPERVDTAVLAPFSGSRGDRP